MPDYKDYIQNVYTALKTKVQGFDRTPDEFQKLIRSNTQYRQNVYNALSNKVQGFNRSTEEFDTLVGAESPIPKAASKITSLPTFQEQQRQLVELDENKFDKAARRDNASWSAAFKTAYNGLIPGEIERGLGAIVELAPSPYALPQEFIRLQKRQAKEDIAKLVAPIKAEVTPEEQAALQFDVTKNSLSQNAKALLGMSGQMVGDVVIGAATGGASYFAQGFNDGVNEYDESMKRIGRMPNEAGRMAFGFVNGTVNGLLESFALNKIFGHGPALKNLQRKVVSEVFDEALKKGGKFTTKELETLAENKIRSLAKTARVRGVKAIYGSTVEGATEGIQSVLTDVAKNITNKAENREVFDNVDMKNIANNFINNSAAGFIFGTPMGLASSLNTHVDNQLLKDISKAKTEDDFNRISSDLSSTLDKQNYTPEHKEAIMNKMRDYAEVKQSIPSYTPSSAQEKAIPKILQRRDIDKTISEKESSLEKLDESLKDDTELEISLLKDRRSYLNDQIREDVSEDKFNYYEENGKFYKRLGENTPEEISRNYFEMADVNERQQKDKPAPTDVNIKPVIIVNGKEYTGADHGEAMINAINDGENIPSPDTQEGEIWREENGLFKDAFGKLNTRDESKNEYGVERSSDIQKTEPIVSPVEEKTYSAEYLRKLDDKEMMRTIDRMDEPFDAMGIAMRALSAGKLKISQESFGKEVGKGVERLTSPFVEKGGKKEGKSVERIAEDLWFGLPENIQQTIEPQDIRNAIIDIASTYRSTLDVGKAYIERYTPKEFEERIIENDYISLGRDAEMNRMQWEKWMNEELSAEEAGIADEKVIEDILKKYEQESTAKGERVAARPEGEIPEGVISNEAYESARKTATPEELSDYDRFRNELLRDEESFRREYEREGRADEGEDREEYIRRKYCQGS